MMRKSFVPALIVVFAVVTLTGCATQKYVDEQVMAAKTELGTKVGEVQTQVEANQEKIGKVEAKNAEQDREIAALSKTAGDALQRANEANKLAKGKFLYEVTLTDNDVKFGLNKAELGDEAKAALDAFAAKVKAENKNVYIEVQGHTCNMGSEKYNLELGYKRAEKVMRYLNREHAFPLHRMNVISYGEYQPLEDNSTKEGRLKNRRVTLVVLE